MTDTEDHNKIIDEKNYRYHKSKVLEEARLFKNKHKKIIEFELKKPISKVSLKELIQLGFYSSHLTKKHSEELF